MQPNGLKKLTITCTRHLPVVTGRIRATAQEKGYHIEEKDVDWQALTNPYEGG